MNRRQLFAFFAALVPSWGKREPKPGDVILKVGPPPVPVIEPKWTGDQWENPPDARSLIAHAWAYRIYRQGDDEDERRMLLDFYMGNQWTEESKRRRVAQGRPCLVENRLPVLAEQVVNQTRARGLRELSQDELDTLACVIVRRNMDAQRLYNLEVSNCAEIAAMDRHFFVKAGRPQLSANQPLEFVKATTRDGRA